MHSQVCSKSSDPMCAHLCIEPTKEGPYICLLSTYYVPGPIHDTSLVLSYSAYSYFALTTPGTRVNTIFQMRILRFREAQGLTMGKWWEWVSHLDMPDRQAIWPSMPYYPKIAHTHQHQGPIT
uniref:Uncharacterized protein n=1 Tax=Myotis myotis TaxID=51298 RepID=A0A7J7XHQ0_MYOMY|nr:hypothetical protein mMyoMyo1_011625 [Myotis myotis]